LIQWRLFVHYVICSNLFISAIATIMSYGANNLLDLDLHPNYFLFVFFATLSSYCLHWYFTEIKKENLSIELNQFRNIYTINNRKLLFVQFVIASLASLYCMWKQQEIIIYVLPAIVATLIYSAPKFPIKALKNLEGKALAKTFYLAAVWIYVTNIVPILLSGIQWNLEIIIYLLANFTFLYVICLLFDFRDQDKDQIKYILMDTNKHFNKIIFVLSCIFVSLSSVLIYLEFSLAIILGLFFTYAFLLLTLTKSTQTKSDYWFYFVLDGLMALPSLLGMLFFILFNK
jgi:hypothetical protein